MKGLEEHLARLGASLQSSADEVEAAKKRALDELRADDAHPFDPQIAKAQEDSVYLGYLYEAWRRAKTGQPGYVIEPVDADSDRPGVAPDGRQLWAVLKDGLPV